MSTVCKLGKQCSFFKKRRDVCVEVQTAVGILQHRNNILWKGAKIQGRFFNEMKKKTQQNKTPKQTKSICFLLAIKHISFGVTKQFTPTSNIFT